MQLETVLETLQKFTGTFPREALQEAIAQREAITPHLLQSLEYVRDHAAVVPEDYYLHIWALLLLAQFRETRAYPLVTAIAQLTGDQLQDLLGDGITEGLGQELASVSGGDMSLIQRVIENPEAYDFARDSAMKALVCLVVAGQRTREEVLEYFRHLFHTAQADPDSVFWSALTGYATDLYPDLVMTEIRAAFEQDLIDPMYTSLDWVEQALAAGPEAARAKREEAPDFRLVEDAIAESEWWACFHPQPAPAPRPLTPSLVRPVLPTAPTLGSRVPAPVYVPQKPGRNDRCPCGSGLKYKKCCLKNAS